MNRYKFTLVILFALSGLVLNLQAQNVDVSKMALITLEGQTQIEAAPAAVWQALTSADLAKKWCPYWQSAKAAQNLDSIGRTIEYMDSWGNKGKSVVLYSEKNKELRVAHVPDDGSYVCQAKFVLQPQGEATVLKVTEQYSDNLDVPTDKDTAMQARQEVEKYLAALKKQAETEVAGK